MFLGNEIRIYVSFWLRGFLNNLGFGLNIWYFKSFYHPVLDEVSVYKLVLSHNQKAILL